MFQSHVGSISTRSYFPARVIAKRFNPTLVRLAHDATKAAAERNRRFNPTLVRLARGHDFQHVLREVMVSIPRWFD